MKSARALKNAHTPNTSKASGDWHVNHSSMGCGDYYGTGVRAKLGRVREDSVGTIAPLDKKLKTPPSQVA